MRASSIWSCCILTSYCFSPRDDDKLISTQKITDVANQESSLQPEVSFMPLNPISPEAKLYSRNLKSLKEKIGKILKEKILKDISTKSAIKNLLYSYDRNCYGYSANRTNRIDLRKISLSKDNVPQYISENIMFNKLMNQGILNFVLDSNMIPLNTVIAFGISRQKLFAFYSKMAFCGVLGGLYVLFKEVNNKMLTEEKNQQNSDFRKTRQKLELLADRIMGIIIKILYRCNSLMHHIEVENKKSIDELIKSSDFKIFCERMRGLNAIFRSKCIKYISTYESLYKNESAKKFLANNFDWFYYILTGFGTIESMNTLLADLRKLPLNQNKSDQVVLDITSNLALYVLQDDAI